MAYKRHLQHLLLRDGVYDSRRPDSRPALIAADPRPPRLAIGSAVAPTGAVLILAVAILVVSALD
jgi:hypothetical protein